MRVSCSIGEPRHVGSAVPLGEPPQGLHASLEVSRRRPLRRRAPRAPGARAGKARRSRQSAPSEPTTSSRSRRTGRARGDGRQVELAGGGHHAQTMDHALEAAIARGGLTRRASGGTAAERHVLEGLGKWPSVKPLAPSQRSTLARARAACTVRIPERSSKLHHVARRLVSSATTARWSPRRGSTPPTTLVPPPKAHHRQRFARAQVQQGA